MRWLPDVTALLKYVLVAITIGVMLTNEQMVSCRDFNAGVVSGSLLEEGCQPSVKSALGPWATGLCATFGAQALVFAFAIVVKQWTLWPSHAGRVAQVVWCSSFLFLTVQLLVLSKVELLEPLFSCKSGAQPDASAFGIDSQNYANTDAYATDWSGMHAPYASGSPSRGTHWLPTNLPACPTPPPTPPPTGGAPMAIMSNCSDGADDVASTNAIWDWNNDDLANPKKGSTLCLSAYRDECLAAEANHEHARLIVTRNADRWYFNTTDHSVRRAPENKLAFSMDCGFPDGCNHPGLNLFVSSPYCSASGGKTCSNAKFNLDNLLIQSDNKDFHQCLTVGCFTRNEGTSTPGGTFYYTPYTIHHTPYLIPHTSYTIGNCAIFNKIRDASACQMKCQEVVQSINSTVY
jgi:hypothetical protein